MLCYLSGLQQEGLFRVSASVRAVESMKQRLDRGEEVDLKQEAEVCTVASLLKLYLRELPEGLVHASIHNTLIQLYNGEQLSQPYNRTGQVWWSDAVTQGCIVCLMLLENPILYLLKSINSIMFIIFICSTIYCNECPHKLPLTL